MLRRNTVRVNLRGYVSAPPSGSDPTEPQEKRQKTTHDFFPTKPPTPRPVEKERPVVAVVGSGGVPKSIGTAGHVVAQEFAPSFASVDGRLVTIEDSVKADPGLAVTMLQGLVLPKDMGRIPQDLQPSLVHACAYLVQVQPTVFFFYLRPWALFLLSSRGAISPNQR